MRYRIGFWIGAAPVDDESACADLHMHLHTAGQFVGSTTPPLPPTARPPRRIRRLATQLPPARAPRNASQRGPRARMLATSAGLRKRAPARAFLRNKRQSAPERERRPSAAAGAPLPTEMDGDDQSRSALFGGGRKPRGPNPYADAGGPAEAEDAAPRAGAASGALGAAGFPKTPPCACH